MKNKGIAPVQDHSNDKIFKVDSIQSVDKAIFFILTPLLLLIAIYLMIKNQCKRKGEFKTHILSD